MLKSILRKQALQQRNSLTEEQWSALNRKLLERFKTLDFSNVSSIHVFLPILHRKEPDTFLLIDWLHQRYPHIQIIVPKAHFETNEMSHYIYLGRHDLAENTYQIPEPQNAQPYLDAPDMVIIPLLAFDSRGYRVGYGKGFYDRFLKNVQTLKIGLSFFSAVEEIIDVHLDDIRLNKCITPDQIIDFDH